MGNSASLPSLESIGRPLGTERSLNSPIKGHLNRRGDGKGPVERLDREVGAGGRRRARREEDGSGRESRRGTRPEEARARRQSDNKETRRQVETRDREQARTRRNTRGAGSARTASEGPGATLSGQSEEFEGDFQAELGSQLAAAEEQGVQPPVELSELEAPTPETSPLNPLVQIEAAGGAKAGGVASAGPAPSGSVRSVGQRAQVAQPMPAPESGKADSTGAVERKTITKPAPTPESQEAQKASQVLQQFRMHLHPGLRSASIQLAPAELGRLSIRVRVENDQVRALVRAESEDTLGILQQHIHELESALSDQGFQDPSFDFELEQGSSDGKGGWPTGQDVSRELEQLVDEHFTPEDRVRNHSNALGVDTYA
jgi:flagellar hook-length control protein FliK